ncbi:MAG: hypothetical protein ACKO7U_01120 [Actinomycetota bacterium]
MSERTPEEREADERRAIDAALRSVEREAPLAGHPAHGSAWRRQAARELVDDGMRG